MRLKKTSNGVRNNKTSLPANPVWVLFLFHFQQPWISFSRFWAPISFHPAPHLSFESVPHLTGILEFTFRTHWLVRSYSPFWLKPQLFSSFPRCHIETTGLVQVSLVFGILLDFHLGTTVSGCSSPSVWNQSHSLGSACFGFFFLNPVAHWELLVVHPEPLSWPQSQK